MHRRSVRFAVCQLLFVPQKFLQVFHKADDNYDRRPRHSKEEERYNYFRNQSNNDVHTNYEL